MDAVQADELFRVETHGIDPIPDGERHGGPRELFWLWSGANLTYTNLISGSLAVAFGLSFWQAVAAVVLGNLTFLLIGVAGFGGVRTGTATLVVARAAFGHRGSFVPGVLNWLVSVGYIIANAVVGALALEEITGQAVLSYAVVIGATLVIALWGHATIEAIERWIGYAVAAGFLVVAVNVLPHVDLDAASAGGFNAWSLALLVLVSTPISNLPIASDYTRYLPRSTSDRAVFWSAGLGGYLPGVLLAVIGAAAATQADMSDPVAGLSGLLPGWFTTPFLLMVLFGSTANSVICLYSAGLNLQFLGVPLSRARSVLGAVVPVAAGTAWALFKADFTSTLTSFLSLMVIVFGPWSGVYLADMWRRRARYDVEVLYRRSGSAYNVPGMISLLGGIALAALATMNDLWTGPLAALADGDLSIAGAVFAAGLYLTLTRTGAKELHDAADADRAGPPAVVHGG